MATLRRLNRFQGFAMLIAPLLLVGSLTSVVRATPPIPPPADTVRGVVTDTTGTPLANVAITLIELDRATMTNRDGTFVIPDVASGRYAVLARLPGYADAMRQIVVPLAATVTIQLTAQVFELAPVSVTATRTAVDPRLATLPADELGPRKLRREHSVSLAHAVEQLPGIHNLSTGEQIGKPIIRGLTGSRVLVLGDGLRLEDYSWSDEDGPSVDTRLADRVEVIRGPASMLYGADALGGVINAIPAALPDAIGRPGFVRGGLDAYGAGNNREAGGALRLEGATGAFGWRAVGIGRFADDYRTPAGPVDNTGFGSVSGEAAAGVRGGWGNVNLRYTRFGGEFKLLEADAPPGAVAGEGGPERKLSDDRVELSANLPVASRVRLEAKSQWQRHSLIEVGDVPGGSPGEEATVFDLLLNTSTTDVMAHHEIGSHVVGTVGVSGTFQVSDTRGPEPIVPHAQINTGGLFAYEQIGLGAVRFSVGGRLDLRHLDAEANPVLGNPADTRDYTVGTASAGVAYAPVQGLTLRGNVGRAWRAPTLFELYANGPRIGEARYEIGDTTLVPETGLNLDAGVAYDDAVFHLSVDGYRNRIDDFIYLAPTDQFIDGLRVYQHTQGPATLWGGEAGVDVRPIALLTLRGRADYVNGTNTALDEPLPLMPPFSGSVGGEIGGMLGWGGRSYFNAEAEFYATQTRLSPFDVPTDGYTLVHLGAGIAPRVGSRTLHVDLQLKNLFDVAYRSYLSRYKEFADNPGRDFVVRLGTEF